LAPTLQVNKGQARCPKLYTDIFLIRVPENALIEHIDGVLQRRLEREFQAMPPDVQSQLLEGLQHARNFELPRLTRQRPLLGYVSYMPRGPELTLTKMLLDGPWGRIILVHEFQHLKEAVEAQRSPLFLTRQIVNGLLPRSILKNERSAWGRNTISLEKPFARNICRT